MRHLKLVCVFAFAALAAILLGACGSSSNESSTGGGGGGGSGESLSILKLGRVRRTGMVETVRRRIGDLGDVDERRLAGGNVLQGESEPRPVRHRSGDRRLVPAVSSKRTCSNRSTKTKSRR